MTMIVFDILLFKHKTGKLLLIVKSRTNISEYLSNFKSDTIQNLRFSEKVETIFQDRKN